MKRCFALWLAVLMLTVGLAQAETATRYDTLTIGVLTAPTGAFYSSVFSNNATDIEVRSLLHGANLVTWSADNTGFVMDTSVVSGMSAVEDRNKNCIYTIALREDLQYSDGTPITAWDYAFTVLLLTSPAMTELGAGSVYDAIQGVTEYRNGETDRISGISVVDEHLFSITIQGSYRPDFYELA